jgi:DNA polymerase-4
MTPGVRVLFIDMNSFYASVEMQDNPGFRGKPTIVVPVFADTSCAIAASYQAKKLGIKTGTSVSEAKLLSPNLNVVLARPSRYVEIHNQIFTILNDIFTKVKPLSIDEFACYLPVDNASEEFCLQLRDKINKQIQDTIGHEMKASYGASSNVFLAKIASEIIKPDGFVYFEAKDALEKMKHLKLKDLPGIARKMNARLGARFIFTIEDLFSKSSSELKAAFGSIVGEQWWSMLRGSLNPDYGMWYGKPLKSIGHSHVIPPQMRNVPSTYEIYKSLVEKSFNRMTTHKLYPSKLHIGVSCYKPKHKSLYVEATTKIFKHTDDQDVLRMYAENEWQTVAPDIPEDYYPRKISVRWTNLCDKKDIIEPLFDLDCVEKYQSIYDIPDRITFGDPKRIFSSDCAK